MSKYIARLARWFCSPRRRIHELRIDLAAVRRHNAGLAIENHRLRTELHGLGDRIIAEIVKQKMLSIKEPDPEISHLFVWSGNASEQLECVVAEFLTQNAE